VLLHGCIPLAYLDDRMNEWEALGHEAGGRSGPEYGHVEGDRVEYMPSPTHILLKIECPTKSSIHER